MPSPNLVINSKSKWSISSLYMSILPTYLFTYIHDPFFLTVEVVQVKRNTSLQLGQLGVINN